MTNTQQTILEKDISALFGFEDMTDEEKAELLDDVGTIIMESATLRFMAESDEAEVARFEQVSEENAGKENMFPVIFETFPRFEEILREEITAFKKEAVDVLAE